MGFYHQLANTSSGEDILQLRIVVIARLAELYNDIDYPRLKLLMAFHTTDGGFVSVSETMETSLRGVFAAGAVRAGATGQAITTAADGALAAPGVERFLSSPAGETKDT